MSESVLKQLAELSAMSVAHLKARWRSLYGIEPPTTYKRDYLIRRLAYRIQELAYGGLSESTRARLQQVTAEDMSSTGATGRKQRPRATGAVVVPGTRLIREWNGRRYEVTAGERGFEFEGRPYRTLTAIAKAITGAHHSGPRFFGLVQPGKGDPS
jgi:hypothetical protein